MKNKSEHTKKLIRSGSALVVAALVLIAATIAWFSIKETANFQPFLVKTNGVLYTVTYYRAEVSDSFKLLTDSGARTIAQREALNWTPVESLDVDTLFPGEYNAFRIDVHIGASCTPDFALNDITCTTASTAAEQELAFDSLFFNLLAVSGSENGTELDSACGSISDLAELDQGTGEYSVHPFAMAAANSGDSFSVYFDVGMTGEDVNSTHDAIRLTGATVNIGSVTIDNSAAGAAENEP